MQVPFRHRYLAGALFWSCLVLAATWPVARAAIDFDDLLPVDEAFPLRAEAVAPGRIELTWGIAEGYYLYRHRMGAEPLEGSFSAEPAGLQLPSGNRHVDEFFGEVETYRGQVTGVLTGQPGAGGAVRLRVKFQGCADAGICYPPQVRTVLVATAGAADATPADAGFAALGRSLGAGAKPTLPLAGTGPGNPAQALPLPPEQAFAFEAIAGDGDTVLMRFTPAPGYYLYRDRSSFRLQADGITAGSPDWPRGVSHHDEHFGNVVVYFDQVEVPLPLRRSRGDATTATLTATFQGCQDEGICYPPMTRTVQVALPAGTVAAAAAGDDAAPPGGAASVDAATVGAVGTVPGEGDREGAAAASAAGDPGARAAEPDAAVQTPPDMGRAGAASDNAARSTPPAMPRGGLLGALLLGLLGGLVLNVMPCVLPILSLKVLGLAQSGESRARARSHALWYTAGVLVAFAAIGLLVVALRAAGLALGWGFQLQQPWFVAALVYLMFAIGLALSGVFTLGGGFGNLGQGLASRSGPVGDFFTGVLACVVASPCIAPFMGGALAFAFTSSAPVALAVFLALGLGLALPFLVIGFVPALADRLPRPGAWMETLKQVLAFPMYLTAAALAWVLGRQRGVDAMALVGAGLVLMALALWWYERRRMRGGFGGRAAALALLLLALLPVWAVGRLQAPAADPAAAGIGDRIAYSAERLRALRADGQVVFVNMTADWCVTCKANERRVLAGEAFHAALEDAGATYMVGDWTNVDPAISAFLEAHRAVGVPLYVVYPRGGGEGEVLPALLDEATVRAALARAAR